MIESFKIWKIATISGNDIEFCQRQGIRVSVSHDTRRAWMHGESYDMTVGTTIALETTTGAQESILLLKYGDKVWMHEHGIRESYDDGVRLKKLT